jgi:hypothetical protein
MTVTETKEQSKHSKSEDDPGSWCIPLAMLHTSEHHPRPYIFHLHSGSDYPASEDFDVSSEYSILVFLAYKAW